MSGKFEEFLAAAEAEAVKTARAALDQWASTLPAPAATIYADFKAYEAAPTTAGFGKLAADTVSTVLELMQLVQNAGPQAIAALPVEPAALQQQAE